MEKTTLSVEVKVIPREVKNGKDKGKKFMAYKIFNKQRGYYEELRFPMTVKNQPTTEGTFIVEVDRNNINRIGINSRKYPLTWIKEIISFTAYEKATFTTDLEGEELPF